MHELSAAARQDERDSPDVRLLLVGHGERRWLLSELLPQLDELETPGAIPESERAAAITSLLAMWHDAQLRAEQTERAFVEVAASHSDDPELRRSSERFHGQVRSLREIIAHRVEALAGPGLAA